MAILDMAAAGQSKIHACGAARRYAMAQLMLNRPVMKTAIKVSAALAVAILLLGGGVFWFSRASSPSIVYEIYREPRLIRMEPQPMLVLERKGDPHVIGPSVFKELFSLYDRVAGISKGAPPAPRVRSSSLDAPKDQLVARYALPLPPGATAVPAPAVLETWTYGDVAQVLYEGPYGGEQPTLQRLREFITAQGYEVANEPEEEYLRGPGLLRSGDPKHYLTMIRYELRARTPTSVTEAAGTVGSR